MGQKKIANFALNSNHNSWIKLKTKYVNELQSVDIDKNEGQNYRTQILLGNYTNVHYQFLLVDQGGNEGRLFIHPMRKNCNFEIHQ